MSFDDWLPIPGRTLTSARYLIVTIWDQVNRQGGDLDAVLDEWDLGSIYDREIIAGSFRTVSSDVRAWPINADAVREMPRYRVSDCCEMFRLPVSMCDDCDNCESCCSCDSCSSCGRRIGDNNSECERCNACSRCCECARCSRCGDACDYTCSECDRCDSCCSCCNLSTVKEGRPWRPTRQERIAFKPERLCGVEWEFNEVQDGSPVQEWAREWRGGIHTDSSCGWECVTAPIGGDHIANCLRDLSKAFTDARAQVNGSCGIHVHVDARDLYWPDIFRLMRVHAHLEPLLYVLAGQMRSKNDFCGPVCDTFEDALKRLDRKGAVLSLVDDRSDPVSESRGRTRARSGIDKKSGGRYRSLNLVPWLARQKLRRAHNKMGTRAPDSTVEFRMHRDSLSGERVVGWAQLCVRLVEWVAKATDADAEKVCGLSALRALAVIAPESMPWILSRIREWRGATRPKKRIFTVKSGKWVKRAA